MVHTKSHLWILGFWLWSCSRSELWRPPSRDAAAAAETSSCDGGVDPRMVCEKEEKICGTATAADSCGVPRTVDCGGVCTGRRPIFIAAGGSHSCVLMDDRSVTCWGWNADGQLGQGNNASVPKPTASRIFFGEGRTARTVATGYVHTCALLDNGTMTCWGQNRFGQLGTGTMESLNAPPPPNPSIWASDAPPKRSPQAHRMCAHFSTIPR